MILIYDENLKCVAELPYTIELLKEKGLEVKDVYDKYLDTYKYSETKFKNPILDRNELREMTREEICATGDLSVLTDGEKIEDGHIVQVPNPSTQHLKYSWSKDTFEWELITTREELQQAKTSLILQHNKKRKEIGALNEEAEYFDVSESVTKTNDELEEIRAKINEIDKVIEEMNKQQ